MKKYLFLMLLLFIGAFATTAFTSCSSDDDDSKVQDLSIVGTWRDQSKIKDAVWTFNKDGKGYCEEKMSAISYKIAFTFTFDGNTFANSTSKCKITKCFCKSTPLVLRNSISFLVSH